MQELLDWLEYIEDDRQQRKIRHTLKDILVIVLFATLANADDWVEMALFAENYQDYLRKYIELKNGIPSHDTIRRVMGMISPEILQQLYGKWQDRLNQDDGELLKKIICIDGKTMRSNKGELERQLTLYPRGVKRMVFVLDKKLLKKKAMKS
ncbi:MAG: ISAs1 family transposase [Pilosibacter sp.]|uniref:ISAs1 family transposase n=1 Tax=Hungatella sp. TaxID=2613924 RepID=UPI003995DB2A